MSCSAGEPLIDTNMRWRLRLFSRCRAASRAPCSALPAGFGQERRGGRILVRQKITQSDLAAMAGIARENVSRNSKEWSRQSHVSRLAGYYCWRTRPRSSARPSCKSELKDSCRSRFLDISFGLATPALRQLRARDRAPPSPAGRAR